MTDPAAIAAALQAGVQHHHSGALEQAGALYRQVLAQDPDNADALHFLGVVRSQQGDPADAVRYIGRALERAPASPAMHINLGNALLALSRHEDAAASYCRAIALQPGNASAHRNLGSALNALQRPEEAEASYRKALLLRPDYPEAYHNLGVTLMELDRNEEAVASFERALQLRPDYPEAHNSLGGALRLLNRHREALACIDKALLLRPDDADSHWNRAVVRLALGDFRGGWKDHEWRGRASVTSRPREFPQPLWLGREPLAGKTILLHSEQGLGDTLQFVRYAPIVARSGARVLLLVQSPLKRLLRDMDAALQVYVDGEDLPGFDCQCPLMSLPHALSTELATIPTAIPYLHADAALAARWRNWLGLSAPNVGLVWAGSTHEKGSRAHRVDRRRSLSLAQFAPLAAVPGVHFVSLQKGPPGVQASESPQRLTIGDPTAELDDFADTAALVSQLDLVITVDTSVAHLAGAMGKPVWILSRFDGCWRWLVDRDDSPWYPTARLFRQPAIGDWDSVMARVSRALSDWASDRTAEARS